MSDKGNRAPLIAFLVANVVSICGTRVSAIAIPWFVLITTGSPVKTGLVAMAEMTPLVIVKAVGGPLIDKVGARRISVVADTASTAIVGLVPLLHTLGLLHFPTLLVLVAIAGAFRGPGDSAKETLIPDIARAARVPLERVTGLESTTERLAGFFAYALAGGLITLVGAVNALWIDAASFGVCALLIARWIPKLAKPEITNEPEQGYGQRLLVGWHFLRSDKLLLPLVTMIAVTNLLDAATSTVLLPVWIKTHGYGPGHTSLILTAFGVTATAFALLASAIGDRIPRKLVFTVAFLIAGAPRFIALAAGAPIWVLMAVYAVGGIGAGFINPVLGAIRAERIPRHLLGRVNSLSNAACWTGVPLGGVVAGVAIAAVGFAPAVLAGGAIYLIATMSPVLIGRHENWKATQDPTGPPGTVADPDRVAVAAP
ncbi:MFS transporter [Kribbella jiaozuonensis]|uniref:Multidrug efflux pump Tap n=1 Tax=Kribbella jiaozuonensis TaxID=2575441 RepID=A0A4U3LHR7_9ACTN|nr:MFS transporter [Kribbella jiaozuonensis]TKK74424.1 MFS transporter [Kribbella jiaozuonensis]